MNSASISRTASLNIDMTSFPPAHSEPDDDGISSTGSITLSVLLGGSPKPNPEHGRKPPTSPSSVNGLYQGRAVSPGPTEFRTALEHRAQKIRESVSLLVTVCRPL